MELRRYWTILLRRWLLIAIPVIMVAGFTAVTYTPPPPPGYNVGVHFLVGQPPSDAAAGSDEERYYAWLTSEYIVNGLTDWVVSVDFKTAVSAELAQQGIMVAPTEFGVVADNVRSKLQLSLQHPDQETLIRLMDAAATVLSEQNAEALPLLGGETAVLVQLDEPIATPIPAGLTSLLDVPLRLAVAFAAGIGLALLVEYLDPTIRDREEVKALELPILGEIPRK